MIFLSLSCDSISVSSLLQTNRSLPRQADPAQTRTTFGFRDGIQESARPGDVGSGCRKPQLPLELNFSALSREK